MAKLTDIMLLQQPAQYTLVVKERGDMETFGKLIDEGFRKIDSYMHELNESPTDIPFVEYPAYEQLTEKNINVRIDEWQ